MIIAIKEVLKQHFLDTGEYITQKMLAEEMVKSGIFKNIHCAQNMIQYNINGSAKGVDFALLEFMCKRFGKQVNDIII
jgi:hypothetical protein